MKIPQLIPLIWVYSRIIVFIFAILAIALYGEYPVRGFKVMSTNKRGEGLIWFW